MNLHRVQKYSVINFLSDGSKYLHISCLPMCAQVKPQSHMAWTTIILLLQCYVFHHCKIYEYTENVFKNIDSSIRNVMLPFNMFYTFRSVIPLPSQNHLTSELQINVIRLSKNNISAEKLKNRDKSSMIRYKFATL